jgi:hypothetical protein
VFLHSRWSFAQLKLLVLPLGGYISFNHHCCVRVLINIIIILLMTLLLLLLRSMLVLVVLLLLKGAVALVHKRLVPGGLEQICLLHWVLVVVRCANVDLRLVIKIELGIASFALTVAL